MGDDGYVKLHRKALKSGVFQDPGLWQLFCYCLLRASPCEYNLENRDGSKTKYPAGSFTGGRFIIAEALGIPASTLRNRLKSLVARGMVDTRAGHSFTVIIVRNWGRYQDDDAAGRTQVEVGQKDTIEDELVCTCLREEPITREDSDKEKTPSPVIEVPKAFAGLELYESDAKFCKQWPSLLKALVEAYPNKDILAEIRKAHAWEVANPDRRKRARGKYFRGWMSRASDAAHGPYLDGYTFNAEQLAYIDELERSPQVKAYDDAEKALAIKLAEREKARREGRE